MIVNNILNFLTKRDWQSTEGETFFELEPPIGLGLPEGYKLHVPKTIGKVDSERFTDNLIEIIGDIYSLTIDDLNVVLKSENTVLKIRIYDDETNQGKISFPRFEGLIENLRHILSDTASFVIDKDVTSTRVPDEVSRYLRLCNFMQTEKGSFVAKIQLPSKELIKESELFDRDEVFSKEINQKLIEVLEFVNNNILEGEPQVTDEYLIENEDKINIKLYKNIESFFDKSDIKKVDFSFHDIENSNRITNSNITKMKLYKLNQFIEQIESHSFEVGDFTFRGTIINLKSKNPDGLRNSIILAGINEEIAMVANANLDSETYKAAIEAHKLKQYIVITGLAKRTKTRVRFIEITSFVVEE